MSQPLPPKPSGIPHLNLDNLKDEDLHAKITSIGLVAHFSAQGICDERWLLAVPRKSKINPNPRPHRCNHFSLWLFIKGSAVGDAVMLDVVVEAYTKTDPWFAKPEEIRNEPIHGLVRASSEHLPSRNDVGCVFEEFRVIGGLTPYEVIKLIHTKGLNLYQHQSDMRRQVGCRHWIRILSREIEALGWTAPGHAKMIGEVLLRFYDRIRDASKEGRGCITDGWEHTPSEDWVELPRGRFVGPGSEVLNNDPVKGLFNQGQPGKILFFD